MTDAIELRGVRLSYTFHSRAGGSMKEHAINLFRREGNRNTVWALDGVDLTVAPGDVLGVIGPNGAGKSTMMKLIARVLQPTEGRVIVRGSVGAMISLGAGFDKDATARENIILYGTLLGRSPAEMRRRVEPILEWADLTDHIHAPLRTFSTGMVARLGFSVASDSVADVLIVDEVLSVGDRAFRRKSEERMRSMVSRGSAVVIVSHSMNTIRALCTNVVWLEAGRVHMLGPADEVVDAYEGPDSESDKVLKRARNAPGPARRTRRLGRENLPPRRARPHPTDEAVETAGEDVGSSEALVAGGDSEEAPRRRRGAQGRRAAKDVAVVTDAAAVSAPTVRPPIAEREPVGGTSHVLIPQSFDDARLLADFLRDGVLVVLDLRKLKPDEVRRVVDFAIGVAYGLKGTMRKIGPGVVLVTPANTEVGKEERRRLIDLGYLEPSDEG